MFKSMKQHYLSNMKLVQLNGNMKYWMSPIYQDIRGDAPHSKLFHYYSELVWNRILITLDDNRQDKSRVVD